MVTRKRPEAKRIEATITKTSVAKSTATKSTTAKNTGDGILEYVRNLAHPKKVEMDAVFTLIRNADPAISDGIKWNAPSFCVDEYFATTNIRSQDCVQIILHLGAKVRADITDQIRIADPQGLLQWLGRDRASVKFRDMAEIKSNGPAFQSVIRQWIAHLKQE